MKYQKKLSFPKKVADLRLKYHATLLDFINVGNQLNIIKDDRAELMAKKHTMKSLDCLRIMGDFNSIEEMLDAIEKKESKEKEITVWVMY